MIKLNVLSWGKYLPPTLPQDLKKELLIHSASEYIFLSSRLNIDCLKTHIVKVQQNENPFKKGSFVLSFFNCDSWLKNETKSKPAIKRLINCFNTYVCLFLSISTHLYEIFDPVMSFPNSYSLTGCKMSISNYAGGKGLILQLCKLLKKC